jgi:hypothetical protein
MFRSFTRLGAVLGVLALALALLGAPAQARPEKRVNAHAAIAGALDRIADGTWTKADLALIKAHPSVAAQVPDPSVPADTGADIGGTPNELAGGAASTRALVTTCGYWVDVWYGKVSSLGNRIFKWHHKVGYCRNGSVVKQWEYRTDYLTEAQSGVQMKDEGFNAWQNGLGTGTATSFRQRRIDYCVFNYGCYENYYPYSQINVFGSGGYTYSGSAG